MKERGFTLIELLAVIVILAIIALIAMPIILGIIKNTKKESIKLSAENYLDSIEQTIIQKNLSEQFNPEKCYVIKGRLNCEGYEESLEVKINGKLPVGGTIYFEDGKIKPNSYLVNESEYLILEENNKIVTKKIPEPKSFSEDSWYTIALNVKAGNIDKYKVGDKKKIELSGDESIAGTYVVRIANTTNPKQCNEDEFSQTACGFVIEFEDIITKHNINSISANKGGWKDSLIREYINPVKNKSNSGVIYNVLPSDLKEVIIDTKVISSHGVTEMSNIVTIDKLYLLSTKEIYINAGVEHDVAYDSSRKVTRQLDYYNEKKVSTNNFSDAIKKYKGEPENWWLRSASSYNNNGFYRVYLDGDWRFNEATYSRGVAPAFRIG